MSTLLKTLIPYLPVAILLIVSACSETHSQESLAPAQFTHDFDYLWSQLRDNYAYFDQKETDWGRVREAYCPKVAEVRDQREFINVLERVLDELYDPHTHLKVNTSRSTRLIPTGLDVWAEWQSGKAIITQLRQGFSAEQAGLRAGMEITSVDGVPVDKAVSNRLGVSLKSVDDAARGWALRALLAGTRDTRRVIEARNRGGLKTIFHLDLPGHMTVDTYEVEQKVQWGIQKGGAGYIRINDLGSDAAVAEFDAALERLKGTPGLIIDLRATPSGGNTSVAEPIMGRLIERRMPYQRGTPARGPSWTREVSPRGDWTYKAPIVVLVGRWTGSMGEGVAVGLDGMRRATVVGTRMAGLNGAVFDLQLPHTGIRLNYAAEKLFHVNGTPREDFMPPVFVNLTGDEAGDPLLEVGLRTLKGLLLQQPDSGWQPTHRAPPDSRSHRGPHNEFVRLLERARAGPVMLAFGRRCLEGNSVVGVNVRGRRRRTHPQGA
jgi:carboxyl-terminal processing protease